MAQCGMASLLESKEFDVDEGLGLSASGEDVDSSSSCDSSSDVDSDSDCDIGCCDDSDDDDFIVFADDDSASSSDASPRQTPDDPDGPLCTRPVLSAFAPLGEIAEEEEEEECDEDEEDGGENEPDGDSCESRVEHCTPDDEVRSNEIAPGANTTSRRCNERRRVHFDDDHLVSVRLLVHWRFAHEQARHGPWEECARDRVRFHDRIKSMEGVLSPTLKRKARHTEVLCKLHQKFNSSSPCQP